VKKVILSLAAAVAIAALPGIASAQSMTVTSVTPTWTYACNELAGCDSSTFNHLAFNNTNADDVRLSWPGNFGWPSQYGFVRAITPITVNVVGPTKFALGVFTHYNQTIPPGDQNGILDFADLSVDLGISGANPASFSGTYRFDHWETKNTANPCPYGTNPCPDKVTSINTTVVNSFVFGGTAYNLRLAGFSTDGGITLTDSFWSSENASNSTTLYAEIVDAPEPSGVALIAAGFGMIVLVGNRRRNNLQA
jgi:hypothetical protein